MIVNDTSRSMLRAARWRTVGAAPQTYYYPYFATRVETV
jgi:hypothetical protein